MHNFLPKRPRVAHKSVKNDDSNNWVDNFPFCDSYNNALPTKKTSHPLLVQTDEFNISPVSSPEQSGIFDFSDELLSIECKYDDCVEISNTEELPNVNDYISDLVSQNEESKDNRSTVVEESESAWEFGHLPITFDDSRLHYLSDVGIKCGVHPTYMDLNAHIGKLNTSKYCLLQRLNKQIRRSRSVRSIWLHQRATHPSSADSGDRESKRFRIVQCDTSNYSSVFGLRSFHVQDCSETQPDATDAIILLPTSGTGKENYDSFQTNSALLGDELNSGDIVKVYAPWLSFTSEHFDNKPVLYSFFWVDRVRSGNEASNGTPMDVFSMACNCLSSKDRNVIESCPKRYKVLKTLSVKSTLAPTCVLSDLLDSKCFVVVDQCRFWILNKLRYVVFVYHFGPNPGIILLGNQNPNKSLCRFDVGSVYSTENLSRLPVERFDTNFLCNVCNRFNELNHQLRSCKPITEFVDSGAADNVKMLIPNEAIHSSDCHFYLWKDNCSKFDHLYKFFISSPRSLPYCVGLANLTRCTLSGYFLLELPEGSLTKTDIVNSFQSKLTQFLRKTQFDWHKKKKYLRLFYLLINSISTNLALPCLCLDNVQSAMELIQAFSLSEFVDSKCSISATGLKLCIEKALFLDDFIILDQWTVMSVQDDNKNQHEPKAIVLSREIENSCLFILSENDFNMINVNQIICFSGKLINVDYSRSHIWPICSNCLCADLHSTASQSAVSSSSSSSLSGFNSVPKSHVVDVNLQQRLKCSRCLATLTNPLTRVELQVELKVTGSKFRTMKEVLLDQPHFLSGIRVLLNMSTHRLCNLLQVSRQNFDRNMAINPKDVLKRLLPNVYAVVVQVDVHNGEKRLRVCEFDAYEI